MLAHRDMRPALQMHSVLGLRRTGWFALRRVVTGRSEEQPPSQTLRGDTAICSSEQSGARDASRSPCAKSPSELTGPTYDHPTPPPDLTQLAAQRPSHSPHRKEVGPLSMTMPAPRSHPGPSPGGPVSLVAPAITGRRETSLLPVEVMILFADLCGVRSQRGTILEGA